MTDHVYDVAIIGGGIVGLATAMAFVDAGVENLVVLEKESRLGFHQTGHNSGVIHSGLYYRPGSLKAENCVKGRKALYRFCRDKDIPVEQCGKVVVATREEELTALDELERRGRANGLEGLERLDPQGLKKYEPHLEGVEGLFVPETGIVDFVRVAEAFAAVVLEAGGTIRMGAGLTRCLREGELMLLETPKGALRCRNLVNCAGLHSDRVARLCGSKPEVQIVPFRGEYLQVSGKGASLVRNLIYPVPDPAYPFLGVHLTRTIQGEIEAGPNAVLAFAREGYGRFSFSWRDLTETLSYPGFRHLAKKHWRMGVKEHFRSFVKAVMVRDIRKMVPGVNGEDLSAGIAGVRAQAVDASGALLDDFCIHEEERMIHVLNAPSPAATASMAIGGTIAELGLKNFGLG